MPGRGGGGTPTNTTVVQDRVQVQAPEQFFLEAKEWPVWKKRWEHYYLLSKMSSESHDFRIGALVYFMGPRADEMKSAFLSGTKTDDYDEVLKALDSHFVGARNVVYERAMFGLRNQLEGESIEAFVTTLYTLSKHCDYSSLRYDLVRDRLILGVRDKRLNEKLMLTDSLDLPEEDFRWKPSKSSKVGNW